MDDWSELLVSDLQTLLAARGLPTYYKKKVDLVERLQRHRLQSTSQQPNDTVVNANRDDDDDDTVFRDNENSTINNDNHQGNNNSDNNERIVYGIYVRYDQAQKR